MIASSFHLRVWNPPDIILTDLFPPHLAQLTGPHQHKRTEFECDIYDAVTGTLPDELNDGVIILRGGWRTVMLWRAFGQC